MSTIPTVRFVEHRFTAWRGGTAVDLTSFLTRARATLGDVSTVGTGASGGDGLSMLGDFQLLNNRPGSDNLAPGASTSSWNNPNPLLSPNRRVKLETRVTPEGEPPGQWVEIFDGLVDSIRVKENANRVEVKARDWAKIMQSTMMPGDQTYGEPGGQRFDHVIQQMLTDHIPNAPVLTVIGTPTFFVEPYQPAFGSVWDAAQALVTQVGWYLGLRRNASGGFVLTLMDPPRDKTTPDWVFTGDDVITADIDRSDRDVRNAFLIRYVDAVTREPTQYPLAGPYVNQQSVDAIGGVQKLMIIELGDTSQIDTAGEAQALLERADHDLSFMFEGTQVELPIMPELNLFDTVSINLPRVGNQQLFAVNSLEHTIEISNASARYRTTIAGMSRVVGKHHRWLDLEVRPGSPNDKPGPHQTKLLAPQVSLLPGQPGFIVSVDAGPASRGVGAVGVEVHWSTTNNFTPGPGSVRASGPEERFEFAPDSNATHYVRVRAFDEHGNYGPYSNQLSIVPARVQGRYLVLDDNVQITGDFLVTGENVEITGDTTFSGDIDMLGTTFRYYDGPAIPANLSLAIGQIGGLDGAPAGQNGIWAHYGTSFIALGLPTLEMVHPIMKTFPGTDTLSDSNPFRQDASTSLLPEIIFDAVYPQPRYVRLNFMYQHSWGNVTNDTEYTGWVTRQAGWRGQYRVDGGSWQNLPIVTPNSLSLSDVNSLEVRVTEVFANVQHIDGTPAIAGVSRQHQIRIYAFATSIIEAP